MGSAVSAIAGVFKTLKTVVGVLRTLSKDYNELLARANSDPGLPVDNPTKPYWLDDPPCPELTDIQSPILPNEADIVIIGSGIAGAAVAWSVLHECRNRDHRPRVVVLEARQLCSGATGRNGGHIKASAHEDFALMRKVLPPERAAELVRFQLRHLDALVGLCRAEGIDVAECREVETVDLFVDEEAFRGAVKQVEDLRKWVPEFEILVWDAAEAREVSVSMMNLVHTYSHHRQKFDANDLVIGALSFKAGALWPYRFVSSIWRKLLDKFPKSLSIETGTPVSNVETESTDTEHPYRVTTNRGIIRSSHVVHATNAFTGHLVPGLRGKMTSLIAHMSSQRPGKAFPDLNGQRSWSIIYASRGFDYVTQRPTKDGIPGDVLLGGGFAQSGKQGMDMIGVVDDAKLDALTVSHNLGIMPAIFEPNWGVEWEGKARKVWNGVIAVPADARPLVGRLDANVTGRKLSSLTKTDRVGSDTVEPGEWIAAGFIGNGMVWAWLSGTAVGIMLAGSENNKLPPRPGRPDGRLGDWFPADLLPTYKRVSKMDIADLAEILFE
jgi:glycine/D-amino acid oxidase-like deaminating enzyme